MDERPSRGSGSLVPDNLVLFEGDWLLLGASWWDDLLRQDPRVMEAITPWSFLEAAARMPVHILDSHDPDLCAPLPRNVDRWLALRDPTGSVRRNLERSGALQDGQLCEQEVQPLLHQRLQSLGYKATFSVVPGSSHNHLSKAALQALGMILQRR